MVSILFYDSEEKLNLCFSAIEIIVFSRIFPLHNVLWKFLNKFGNYYNEILCFKKRKLLSRFIVVS